MLVSRDDGTVDMQRSERCGSNPVEVQILFPAPSPDVGFRNSDVRFSDSRLLISDFRIWASGGMVDTQP